MAKELILPKLGNSVESCIILEWRVSVGDSISIGDIVCEAETDKTTVEVESDIEGTLLRIEAEEGDEATVLSAIAIIGKEGDDLSGFGGDTAKSEEPSKSEQSAKSEESGKTQSSVVVAPSTLQSGGSSTGGGVASGISPRARMDATAKGIDLSTLGAGSGPGGRIIARDIEAIASGKAPLSLTARGKISGNVAPMVGSGVGGRVLVSDLRSAGMVVAGAPVAQREDKVIAVKGVRKIVAERMLASLNGTAQLTHSSSADATMLLGLRKRFKGSGRDELSSISLNDLLLFATAQTLLDFPYMNSHFLGDKIIEFGSINLGFAVDTPRGLMVPVIRDAQNLNILQLSAEASRLVEACRSGSIEADELSGGTFTISNLGGFGVDSFTPVLNRPEVGILGLCSINPKPQMVGDDVKFVQHIGLSLTYDHQAVDGAPAARFIKGLSQNIADLDLLISGLV